MENPKEYMERRRQRQFEFSKAKDDHLKERKAHIEEETRIFNKDYEQFLKDMLVKYELDGRVIREKDGQEGEIHVEENPNLNLFMPFVYKFYPVTKKGILAQRPNGHVGFELINYVPKNN